MIDLEKIDNLLQEAKGSDFIKAERVARMMGDPTPSIIFSAKFQAILLANLFGVPVEDIEELPVHDFTVAISKVNAFLFGQGLEAAKS